MFNPPIVYAVLAENFECVRQRCGAGLDINFCCERVGTAVLQAIRRDNCQITRYLLERGADLSISHPSADMGWDVVRITKSSAMRELLVEFGVRFLPPTFEVADAVSIDGTIFCDGLGSSISNGWFGQAEQFYDWLKEHGFKKKARIVKKMLKKVEQDVGTDFSLIYDWYDLNKSWLHSLDGEYIEVKGEDFDSTSLSKTS